MLQRAEILGTNVEYRWIGPPAGQAATIVFLHEGLGCTAMWRDFPERVVSTTGCGALVYSRSGYGGSDRVTGPRPLRFMHDEALAVLPAVIGHFKLEDVILFGHSDGASIALIYAGSAPKPVRALVVEAPHVFVEPLCIESIRRIADEYLTTPLHSRLLRYHGANTDAMFNSWTEVWLRPEFARWNIENVLAPIMSPLLVVQGLDDQYGTVKQVEAVLRQVGGRAESRLLPDCGHSPHSERADEVLDAVTRFIRSI